MTRDPLTGRIIALDGEPVVRNLHGEIVLDDVALATASVDANGLILEIGGEPVVRNRQGLIVQVG